MQLSTAITGLIISCRFLLVSLSDVIEFSGQLWLIWQAQWAIKLWLCAMPHQLIVDKEASRTPSGLDTRVSLKKERILKLCEVNPVRSRRFMTVVLSTCAYLVNDLSQGDLYRISCSGNNRPYHECCACQIQEHLLELLGLIRVSCSTAASMLFRTGSHETDLWSTCAIRQMNCCISPQAQWEMIFEWSWPCQLRQEILYQPQEHASSTECWQLLKLYTKKLTALL